ncbi:unnamed protein product [Caenorhabditis sp. 36 PRJEB53466]|nr:unnamed protein product [Caenorhabditis sp. 36 PRJEB53466]
MSNAVSSRGPGRGKPNQGYLIDHNVAPLPDQQFVMPVVAQVGQMSYRPMPPTQMQSQQFTSYGNPPPPFVQSGHFYQQQQQPAQQQSQQHHQSQYGYRSDYHPAMYNQYSYQGPPQGYPTEAVNYQPQHQITPQNPPVVPEQQRRKKNVLAIVDPTTKKAIEVPPLTTAAAPVVPPPPLASEVAEKKEQFSKEFMDKVKQGLKGDAAQTSSVTKPVSLPNFSVPPPQFIPPVKEQISAQESVTETPVQQNDIISNVKPPTKNDVCATKQAEGAVTSVPALLEDTSKKPSLLVESPTNGAAETAAGTEERATIALQMEDSKEEIEDDKFDENDSECGPSPTLEENSENSIEKSPEELAKEKAQKEAEEKEKQKLHEEALDRRIEDLIISGDGDIPNGTYGRDFMVAVRDYEKAFSHTPCPLTPQKLSEFGLDIKTMRITDSKKLLHPFTPNWVPNNKTGNRQPNAYRGRTTTDGTGRGAQPRERGQHNKRPPTVRASIERVTRVTLASSKDAWKPERQKNSDNVPEEEVTVKEVCKKVRSLMNKITPTSQIPLTKEFISYNVSSDDSQLGQVVNIVFDKAVEEPKFCALYAELCRAQVEFEIKSCGGKSLFRNKVLTRTQSTFQTKSDVDEERMAIIEKEEDPAKRDILAAEERQKFRRRKFGVMTFIGHLYRNQLLSTKIVQTCTFELFASILPKKQDDKELELRKEDVDEESVHCALQLIETVGPLLDKSKDTNTLFLDQWFQKLEAAKPYCSNKIRFMIMNLIELRSSKWVPRKSVESGPKKIDEIHNDIRQEKIENEKARDQYDRDRDRRHGGGSGGGVRTNSNSMRKQGPVSRNSIERPKGPQHPEQKRAAAAANTKLASSNVQPKNISLSSSMNDSTLGKSKKEWLTGASGGGNTSESPKSAWVRRDSNDQRKKSMVDEKQSALAAAKEFGALSMSSRRSTSQNSITDKVDEELTEEDKVRREKIKSSVHNDIKEVVAGDLPLKDLSINDYVGLERYAKPSLSAVYELVIRSVSDRGFKDEEKLVLAHVLRLSLTGKEEKQAFIDGVTRFCKFAVEAELWHDFPQVWTTTAEVLVNTMHVPQEVIGEKETERLALNEMGSIFLTAKMEGKKKFALFVSVLKQLVEIEMKENGGQPEALSWDFQDLPYKAEMEKDGLSNELDETTTKCNQNLFELLKSET